MALRAQANSVARIASPIGITMNAGPGRTMSHAYEKYGAADNRDDKFAQRRQQNSHRAMLNRKRREPLQQLRRGVGDDLRKLTFVTQLEDVTDAMNLGDQSRFAQWHAKTRAQPPRT
jgi:hypothetical protein